MTDNQTTESLEQKVVQKVLLVEDTDLHADGYSFPNHVQVTRVKTFEEAIAQLYGSQRIEGKNPDRSICAPGQSSYHYKRTENPHGYDAVLSDLNFPLGKDSRFANTIGRYNHKELEEPRPLGFYLALIASQVGIKKIGIYTDTNHHNGAMAAPFDLLEKSQRGTYLGQSRFVTWDIRTVMSEGRVESDWQKEWKSSMQEGMKFLLDEESLPCINQINASPCKMNESDLKQYPAMLSYLNYIADRTLSENFEREEI